MSLETISLMELNNSEYQISENCKLVFIHIKIKNIEKRISDLVKVISDTSWIDKMNSVFAQDSYRINVNRTVAELVNNVMKSVNDEITSELGEYLVSMSSQEVLCKELNHILIPLSELWKEKVKGNPGFDFHTQTPSELISFGEAKYSFNSNPYNTAIEQIKDFISLGKDVADLVHLENIPNVSTTALYQVKASIRAFSIAFSLNAQNIKLIIKNVVKKLKEANLLRHPEIFIIGVEI